MISTIIIQLIPEYKFRVPPILANRSNVETATWSFVMTTSKDVKNIDSLANLSSMSVVSCNKCFASVTFPSVSSVLVDLCVRILKICLQNKSP